MRYSGIDLPPQLVSDLDLMKLFNGNFIYEEEEVSSGGSFGTFLLMALSVLYDGVSWTFTYRSDSYYNACGCTELLRPRLFQFTMKEGAANVITSPFSQVKSWLRELRKSRDITQPPLTMKMTSQVMTCGTTGTITYKGAASCFKSSMKVRLNREGTRVLVHRGRVKTPTGKFTDHYKLQETSVAPEDAFLDWRERDIELGSEPLLSDFREKEDIFDNVCWGDCGQSENEGDEDNYGVEEDDDDEGDDNCCS